MNQLNLEVKICFYKSFKRRNFKIIHIFRLEQINVAIPIKAWKIFLNRDL